LPGHKFALVNVAGRRPDSRPTELLLKEHERWESLEVIKILPESGAAELRHAGTNLVVTLPGAETNSPAPALWLVGAGTTSVLATYGELAGRSLLRSPMVPDKTLTLRSTLGDKAEVAKLLSEALATKDIAVIPAGEKFTFVVWKQTTTFWQKRIAESTPPAPSAADPAIVLAGNVVYTGADLVTLAATYAELSGRSINPAAWPSEIPQAQFSFKNQTALTKAEILYSYDSLFELCGLKMVPDGDKLLKPELIRLK
jgi:hypothetical protein